MLRELCRPTLRALAKHLAQVLGAVLLRVQGNVWHGRGVRLAAIIHGGRIDEHVTGCGIGCGEHVIGI